jgi:hypothetical protein
MVLQRPVEPARLIGIWESGQFPHFEKRTSQDLALEPDNPIRLTPT